MPISVQDISMSGFKVHTEQQVNAATSLKEITIVTLLKR